MRVIKPQRLGLLTKTMPYDNAGLFVVSTLTFFDLLDPTDILAETAMWPLVAQELPKGAIFDAAYPKPHGEFLIAGRAMAKKPVQAMHVAVTVGEVSRFLSIFGDRHWENTAEGPVFSQPIPFTEMPLTSERAFGGEGFIDNPTGCGFYPADVRDQVGSLPLPNIEIAGSEIRTAGDHPAPALIGAVSPDNPARLALAGTYDKAWVAHQMPDWPQDFNPKYFMAAQAAQQQPQFFTGDELIRVVGMSARHPDVQSRLPGIKARAFVAHASSGGQLSEVSMHTDTVWILGSELKGIVVNRGVIAVSDREGRDISDVMIAYEHMQDAPRPVEHYQEVHRLRTDPEEAYKYLLADGQLSPLEDPEEIARREAVRIAAAEERQEQWTESRNWRLERKFTENGLPASLVPKMNDLDLKPIVLPSKEDIARGDVDIARLISDVEDLSREAELKVDMASAEIFGLVKQIGVTPPNGPVANLEQMEALSELADTGKGYLPAIEDLVPQDSLDQLLASFENAPKSELPPSLEADPQVVFEAARGRFLNDPSASVLAPAREMFEELPESAIQPPVQASKSPTKALGDTRADGLLEDYLAQAFPGLGSGSRPSGKSSIGTALAQCKSVAGPGTAGIETARNRLGDAEENIEDALAAVRRTAADAVAPLQHLGSEAAELLGAFVRSYYTENGSLAGRDLAGAALVAFNGDAADLSGSFLESCDLSGSVFRRANCENIVLTGAKLSETDFSGANLTGANLCKIDASNATFKEATFRNCTIIGSDFTDCDFTGAVLENCTLLECKLPGAHFTAAKLEDCSFLKSDLKGLKAERAFLEKTNFMSSGLDRSDWSAASLKKVSFAEVSFHAATLSNARLDECGWFGATDMSESNFSHVHATKCGFQDARIRESAFLQAVFEDCNMAGTNLDLADMRLSSWQGSLFTFARITKADLFGANLRQAVFHGADLSQSNLRYANFFRTDLSEATIAFADFTHSNMKLTNLEARL